MFVLSSNQFFHHNYEPNRHVPYRDFKTEVRTEPGLLCTVTPLLVTNTGSLMNYVRARFFQANGQAFPETESKHPSLLAFAGGSGI